MPSGTAKGSHILSNQHTWFQSQEDLISSEEGEVTG